MLAVWLVLTAVGYVAAQDITKFPDGFLLGVATAAYQVEGGWDADGKGENIWDHMLHEHPEMSISGENGDVASDSYHKYLEDVQLIADLGANHYRFSIAWSRVLPRGYDSVVNPAGIQYYNNLINALLEKNIIPMVTMYHWDLPQPLQNIGGWPNPRLADYFVDYARVLFENFGDRVKYWITFNEPLEFTSGYSTYGNASGIGDYLAAHTVLLAHARTYRLYQQQYKPSQQGQVGITLNSEWEEPRTNATEDIEAAERAMQFRLGWFAHPIYSAEGDYPPIMRERVDANSAAEGFSRSRLPTFTTEEVELIKGTSDFFGLNHYSTRLDTPTTAGETPSHYKDTAVESTQDPSWPGQAYTRIVPWGFRKLLNWVSQEYGNVPIIITENGYSDYGEFQDDMRVEYYTSYLAELLKALYLDGVNIFGYTAWSLIDNLEWISGYSVRFGIYYVNVTDPNRTRLTKYSTSVLGDIMRNRQLPTAPSKYYSYNLL